MKHGLAGIMRTDQPGRPNIVCQCGCIASGVKGTTWTVVVIEGKASCSPSFNWPGHFHETAHETPVLEWPENFRDANECGAEVFAS